MQLTARASVTNLRKEFGIVADSDGAIEYDELRICQILSDDTRRILMFLVVFISVNWNDTQSNLRCF